MARSKVSPTLLNELIAESGLDEVAAEKIRSANNPTAKKIVGASRPRGNGATADDVREVVASF